MASNPAKYPMGGDRVLCIAAV
ncbi:hypothetical protein MESS2_1280022 [Mesorhizobium metallidurans STM 2683]|uniref:Uncharacterized protein n=1 Tax=Mesorhizobium metallidurans STM 2683 TaxID=1297569 RepID=M5EIF2_9HYPH|nr:hypothetical protein MESS2_1280022 [Mesorhizobium metallidurans STM 2683]